MSMSSVIRLRENALAQGFYTISEAARLIEVGSAQRIRGWIKGYPNRKVGPVLRREFAPIDEKEELSFLDLMEIRFVEYFRYYKVSIRTLRISAEEIRKELNIQHPFATDKIRFCTDGKCVYLEKILKRSAEEAGDAVLMNIVTKQFEIYEAIKRTLIAGVIFDPNTHLVERWHPRPARYPEIFIDPRIAYGKPVTPSGIPTRALHDSWLAEGKRTEQVAAAFEIPLREVNQAIGFEVALNENRH